ncbi:MAG: hypothetical protein COZ18_03455 [Flexibacter sp. CG_4_10_14_3_um_filter_32_15]|nr:MAG: hypothetical protein COZ18_03455 [Flexibacter sp. CG_4_10_14_3_um_filter_32_15]
MSGNVHKVTYQKGETDQFMHRYTNNKHYHKSSHLLSKKSFNSNNKKAVILPKLVHISVVGHRNGKQKLKTNNGREILQLTILTIIITELKVLDPTIILTRKPEKEH